MTADVTHEENGQQLAVECRPRSRWPKVSSRMIIGISLIGVLGACAILAPWIVQNPLSIAPAERLRPPSHLHFLGTDNLGRDVLARTIYAARVSIIVGLGTAGLAVGGGLVLGLACGLGRLVDEVIMRFVDLVSVFPAFLLAVALLTLMAPGTPTVIVVIAIADLPRASRLVRSVLLSVRELPYIDAAISSGTHPMWIILRHIAPATWPSLIVLAAYLCASAILAEAGLSFLGAGTPPETPSWGNMIAGGARFFIVAPWTTLAPGAALALATLGVMLVADALRDRFDPRRDYPQ
ncbi:ABC transporter permease [Bradyrhizobium sp. USDA 336]|uniref:ABC transporter permease n=1 Tax=Bradyrhizobium sp. USDA 336 TaxID=3156311 RepID=UPI0038336FEE